MANERYWAVIPAAGIGRRMNSEVPKQYLPLKRSTVIECTIERLLSIPLIETIVVVLAADDEHWGQLEVSRDRRVTTTLGGAERCHSVLAGLEALGDAADDDWVLVHDAARPCVRTADINKLIDRLADHDIGGILAAPVRDTLKRCAGDGAITATVERGGLWHAFTPQMFRLRRLRTALTSTIEAGGVVTDEAQAIETLGGVPVVVESSTDNIKITHPADLAFAELILQIQEPEENR